MRLSEPEPQSSGTRRREILQAEMRHAADLRDVAGICTAYVKTAVQILAEFPNISTEEGPYRLLVVVARGTALPYTSIVPRWMYPPTPWPLPGIRSTNPTSSTLLRSGLLTQI